MKDSSSQKGQTLVFILLISVVGLTLGLAMAGRSIQRVTQTEEQESYNRAFSAAEAGLEEVALRIKEDPDLLKEPIPRVTGSLGESGASYEYECNPVTSQNFVVLEPISKDDVGQINLVRSINPPLYTTGTVKVCWKAASVVDRSASLIMSLITKSSAVADNCVDGYCLYKYAVNPGGVARGNGFADPDVGVTCSVAGYNFAKQISIPASESAQLLRIRAMYNEGEPAAVRAETTTQFGFQYQECTATGTVGDNQAKQKFTISYPSLPAIFDYVLFSGSTVNPLTHQ